MLKIKCQNSINFVFFRKLRYPGLALALTEQTTLKLGKESLPHASICTLFTVLKPDMNKKREVKLDIILIYYTLYLTHTKVVHIMVTNSLRISYICARKSQSLLLKKL